LTEFIFLCTGTFGGANVYRVMHIRVSQNAGILLTRSGNFSPIKKESSVLYLLQLFFTDFTVEILDVQKLWIKLVN